MLASWHSVFERSFDVVIYGAGYAGYAAARQLHASGRSVLLLDTRGDLLWESGRAFVLDPGFSKSKAWAEWLELLRSHSAGNEQRIDGALAEIIATHQLLLAKIDALYYASPVAVEQTGGNITSVIVATKAGPRRIVARQWIDASESGLLTRLACPDAQPRTPSLHTISIYLERNDWPVKPVTFSFGDKEMGFHASFKPALWSIERCLHVTVSGSESTARAAYLPVLEQAHALAPELFSTALVTHWSVEPYPHYQAEPTRALPNLPSNLAIASPAFTSGELTTLAERFDLGLEIATSLASLTLAEPSPDLFTAPFPLIEPREIFSADVAVAGAGTGGALAALGAARQDASVVSFDLLAFPGGIGSGGGIHVYYYGVPGGLQNELDDRVRKIQTLFGSKGQILGFHPDSKKLVLMSLFEEANIQFLRGSMLHEVIKRDDRIVAAIVATPTGPVRLEASAWIDGTGDGDLCALAGAAYRQGRDFDGLTHAYSQSSGEVNDNSKGQRHMNLVNYDAGWCDASNPEDLTRARLLGISQYLRPTYSDKSRTTYIAPALGLRELREIECDVMLSLGDFLEHRRFPDCIGFLAGHYDSHIRDYEFESDESMFWVWFTRSGFGKSACEISYRMLLPKDLSNVWIASRAAGRTHDGQFPFRMQRDMQRIGEASGTAAALAVKHRLDSRHVPLDELREVLCKSEAINVEVASRPSLFRWEDEDVFTHQYPSASAESEVEAGLQSMSLGQATAKLWPVYRAGERAKPQVHQLLSSPDPSVSWLAAGVAAMWGDAAAEPRLIEAIENFEDGFASEDRIGSNGKGIRPESNHWYQFNWVVAISLLRMCGTSRCIETLNNLSIEPNLPFNLRTAIAVTFGRLAQRGIVTNPKMMVRLLQPLLADPMPGRNGHPQRQLSSLYLAWFKQRGASATESQLMPSLIDETTCEFTSNHQDYLWQLHLAVAKARHEVGLPPQPEIENFRNDKRAVVRQAFAQIS